MFAKLYNDKIKKLSTDVCHFLELVAALFVLIGVIMVLISLIPNVGELWAKSADTESFLEFLEQVLAVVIGVEFMKMLCRPNADNVMETIIFLVARHMIVENTTTPLENLISTISIVLLCFMRCYLKKIKEKKEPVAEQTKTP